MIATQQRMLIALMALTLAVRLFIPAGFMPTAGSDGLMRISLCTAMGTQTVWIDQTGKVQKKAPAAGEHEQQPCSFAAAALAMDLSSALAAEVPIALRSAPFAISLSNVAIGRGLAAPPPPATGPPVLI